jgi:hypothetical protein
MFSEKHLQKNLGMSLRGMAIRDRICGHVRPFYERAMSDLDSSMHRSLWV